MPKTMSYEEWLALPEDSRGVSGGSFSPEPGRHRCTVLELDPATGATVLVPVEITGDLVAKLERSIPKREKWDPGFIVVTARTHSLGDQAPYFSVTGELWDSAGWYRNGQDGRLRSCGMVHDEALRWFPKLAPLVALHGSDATTGEPTYALENGWYWYRQGGEGCETAARLLRVDEVPTGLNEADFRAFAYEQVDRWASEAAAGRALLLELGATS